mmetsp:Transcript_10101/g.22589  ORF Transcript_10101/g.22589 Transcript_10101/m.22589 type:complete len:828 (-) Transcript_10101:271-2754(-)
MRFGATLESSVADDWRGYAVDYGGLKMALKGQRRTGGGAGIYSAPGGVSPLAGGTADTSIKPVSKSPSSASMSGSGSSLRSHDRPPLSPKKAHVSHLPSKPPAGPGHRRVPSALRVSSIGEPSATAKTERHSHNRTRDRTVSWDFGGDAEIPAIPRPGMESIGTDAHVAQVTKEDIEAFFRIYDNSKNRLEKFYEDKKSWALAHMQRLEDWVEPPGSSNSSGETSSESTTAIDPDEVLRRIDAFHEELDRIIEFLHLNQTAFSKILKKFDKNTGLKTREARLGELRLTHGFLDGALFSELKGRVQRLRLKAVAAQSKVDQEAKKSKPTAEDISNARRKRVEALNIDRTERYLRRMEVGSTFFSENIPRQLPQFTNAEVELGKKLGQGEFANVKEVLKFMVKERCHLCFFHQGNSSHSNSVNSVPSGSEDHGDRRRSATGTGSDPPSTHESRSSITGEETKEEHCLLITNGASPAPAPAPAPAPDSDSTIPPTGSLTMDFDDNISDYDDLEDDHDEELLESRGFMKDHCLREGTPRYAVKQLRSDLDADMRREAALDLAIEAKFLATLSHPNIIKQRGTSGVPGHSQFFIVLDRLFLNMTEKRIYWRAEKEKCRSGPFNIKKDKKVLEALWNERLTAVYDVARAMKHLHENMIVYRDLKPDNVGFDVRGDVKLFDFGLAKELTPRYRVGKDQYKASGLTGSRRYMAPEVVMCKPYGLSVDVFSFGIFLWEILSLKEPFEDYDVNKHSRLVVKKGQRPMIKNYWPSYVKELMKACWSKDPKQRPTFAEIYSSMKGMPELRATHISMTERTRMLMDRSVTSLYQDVNNEE